MHQDTSIQSPVCKWTLSQKVTHSVAVCVRMCAVQRQTARIEKLSLKIRPPSYFCHFFHLQVPVLHLICQLGARREACHSYLKDRGKKGKSTVIQLTIQSCHFRRDRRWATLPGAACVQVSRVLWRCDTSAGHRPQKKKKSRRDHGIATLYQ